MGENHVSLIKLPVMFNGRLRIKAMLDSGAQGNFVAAALVRRAGLNERPKARTYALHVANGRPMPGKSRVRYEIDVPIEIHGHQEWITLDVMEESRHDLILGIPWLRKHNPHVNWEKKELSFKRCNCTLQAKPTHRTTQMVDERAINTIVSRPEVDKHESTLADAGRNHQVTKRKDVEKRTTHDIPDEYKEWSHLFREEEGKANLPKHQPWDHTIDLEEGKTPPFGPLYGKSGKELQWEEEFINKNLDKGYIRESKSPAASPFMFVLKKDGAPRPCIDYRALNNITIKNRYPLPNISELRDRLSRAKIFTAMDLRDGYHLVRMKEGEEWKTAFRSRYGLFEYTVMPFGLTNAPATFQELINNTLRNYLDIFVVAYLDDILIYSENEKEHVTHVKIVLDALRQAHLRIKPEKCKFHVTELEFLGHVVNTKGFSISPEKIETIRAWPTPASIGDVREFLGFCGFNRQFIKDYSKITIPLTALTKKDVTFKWTEQCDQAFKRLVQASISAPVLVAFRSDEPLRMETDASDLAIGACVKQERDEQWHPVAYYSYKFIDAETRYDIHDKELYAIVKALKHWRIYAHGCSELTIFTDHKNLLRFTTTKELTPRQARWSEALGQYKFKILYTPGKENGRADALSRRKDLAGDKIKTYSAILKENKDGSLGPTAELNQLLIISKDVPKRTTRRGHTTTPRRPSIRTSRNQKNNGTNTTELQLQRNQGSCNQLHQEVRRLPKE